MDINLTLLGEIITFIIFILITMKYVWPPIVQAMEDRQKKIANGIAAGERGEKNLKLAQEKATELISTAKKNSNYLIERANDTSAQLIEDAKIKSREQSQQALEATQTEIAQQMNQAKLDLQKDTAHLAIIAAEKILQKKIDQTLHNKMLDELFRTISSEQ